MSLDCLFYAGVAQASPKKEKREEVEHPITGVLSGRSFKLLPEVFYEFPAEEKLNFLESRVPSFNKSFFKINGDVVSLDETKLSLGDQDLNDCGVLYNKIVETNSYVATIDTIGKWTQTAAIISGFAASLITLLGQTGVIAAQASLVSVIGGVGVGLGILGFAVLWYKNVQIEHMLYLSCWREAIAANGFNQKLREQATSLETFFDFVVNSQIIQKSPAVTLAESSSDLGFSLDA